MAVPRIQLLSAWLYFTNNTFPPPMSIEEVLDQPLFLNPHTKLQYNSDNPYFYCLSPQNISDKFTIIRDICKFLQPGLILSVSFSEKLNLPNVNHNKIYKSVIELIPNNWIHLLKTKTSQKSLLKVFCFNCRGIKRIKIGFKMKTLRKSIFGTLSVGFKMITLRKSVFEC